MSPFAVKALRAFMLVPLLAVPAVASAERIQAGCARGQD